MVKLLWLWSAQAEGIFICSFPNQIVRTIKTNNLKNYNGKQENIERDRERKNVAARIYGRCAW